VSGFPEIAPGLHVTSSIVDLTGATYRQINYWITNGYIKPLVVHQGPSQPRPNKGSGNHHLFDECEVKVAWLIAHLVEQGMAPIKAGPLARDLMDNGEAVMGALTIRLVEP